MKLKEIAVAVALAAGTVACNPIASVAANAESTEQAVKTQVPNKKETASEKPTPSALPIKDLGPGYKEGMSYVEFREKLLEDGWKPDGDPDDFLDSMLGSNYKNICRGNPSSLEANICALSTKFPEAVICESTGGGSCLMGFTKDHMHIDVNTSGDIESVFNSSHKYGFYADHWRIHIK